MVISCCSKRIQFRMGLSLISLNLYKEATNHIDKLLWLHIVVKVFMFPSRSFCSAL